MLRYSTILVLGWSTGIRVGLPMIVLRLPWGSRLMPLRVCHYADLLCRYDADMGLKNVSLCRYYAVMPLEFLLGWWAHTGFLVDFRTVKLPPQFDNSVPWCRR